MKTIITTVLELLGLLIVAAGVALIYFPAGLITAGLAALAISWRVSR